MLIREPFRQNFYDAVRKKVSQSTAVAGYMFLCLDGEMYSYLYLARGSRRG